MIATEFRLGGASRGAVPFEAAPPVHVHFDGHLHHRAGPPDVGADAAHVADLWMRYGELTPDRMLGDFAFALHDAERSVVFAARDVAGVRPLYYRVLGADRIALASDIASLVGDGPRRFDPAALRLTLEVPFGGLACPDRTLLEGIRIVPPGHALRFDRSGVRVFAWWDPDAVPMRGFSHPREAVDELRALLHEAVACRVSGREGAVASHISGGLDSSSMAVLTQRLLRARGGSVLGLSWSPPRSLIPRDHLGRYEDERDLIDAIARREGFEVAWTTVEERHVLADLEVDLTLTPNATLLHERAISEWAAGQGVRTIVSGWGGDELIAFNGRGYFAGLARAGRLIDLHRALRARGRTMGLGITRQAYASVLKPLLAGMAGGGSARPRRGYAPWGQALRPALAEVLRSIEPLGYAAPVERPGVRRMQLDLLRHGHLAYRTASWTTHGRAIGIDYVFPMLDRRLIEFALSVPPESYMNEGWKRWLYRTATEGILTDDVRWKTDKFDHANFAAAIRLRHRFHGARTDAYRRRAGNPFVDVGAALDLPEPPAPPDRYELPRRGAARAGRAPWHLWLAFVDPATGY